MINGSHNGLVSLLTLAVATRQWLNRTSQHNRRLNWQLQAAVVAGDVGCIAGRMSTGKDSIGRGQTFQADREPHSTKAATSGGTTLATGTGP